MFNLETVGASTFEAVTVDELKAHCRIFHSADDAYLDLLRVGARQQVEKDLNIAVVGQQYTLHLDSWFDHHRVHQNLIPIGYGANYPHIYYPHIAIPVQPLQSVESIMYTDTDGDTQTLDPSLYEVKPFKDPPHIRLVEGTFPDIQAYSEILVTFTAGYADADSVPQVLKHAVFFLASHWYEHREAEVESIMRDVPLGYERIINRWNVKRFK